MICIECGNISISKRCVSCVIARRQLLRQPLQQRIQTEKPRPKQKRVEPPVEVMPEPDVVEAVAPPPPRAPRPRWEPEREVAEDPFAHKDLPRHYFQREGKG